MVHAGIVTKHIKCYHAEMESRGLEDAKNVKTSHAYFFEGFISFFKDFFLTISVTLRDCV